VRQELKFAMIDGMKKDYTTQCHAKFRDKNKYYFICSTLTNKSGFVSKKIDHIRGNKSAVKYFNIFPHFFIICWASF
jgi:hypothetical protein